MTSCDSYGYFRCNLVVVLSLLLTVSILRATVSESTLNQSQLCDNSFIVLQSNSMYAFVGCNWSSLLPTLSYTSCLSNVTINVVNSDGLPIFQGPKSCFCEDGGILQYVIENTHTAHASPQPASQSLIQIGSGCVESFSFCASNSKLSFNVSAADLFIVYATWSPLLKANFSIVVTNTTLELFAYPKQDVRSRCGVFCFESFTPSDILNYTGRIRIVFNSTVFSIIEVGYFPTLYAYEAATVWIDGKNTTVPSIHLQVHAGGLKDPGFRISFVGIDSNDNNETQFNGYGVLLLRGTSENNTASISDLHIEIIGSADSNYVLADLQASSVAALIFIDRMREITNARFRLEDFHVKSRLGAPLNSSELRSVSALQISATEIIRNLTATARHIVIYAATFSGVRPNNSLSKLQGAVTTCLSLKGSVADATVDLHEIDVRAVFENGTLPLLNGVAYLLVAASVVDFHASTPLVFRSLFMIVNSSIAASFKAAVPQSALFAFVGIVTALVHAPTNFTDSSLTVIESTSTSSAVEFTNTHVSVVTSIIVLQNTLSAMVVYIPSMSIIVTLAISTRLYLGATQSTNTDLSLNFNRVQIVSHSSTDMPCHALLPSSGLTLRIEASNLTQNHLSVDAFLCGTKLCSFKESYFRLQNYDGEGAFIAVAAGLQLVSTTIIVSDSSFSSPDVTGLIGYSTQTTADQHFNISSSSTFMFQRVNASGFPTLFEGVACPPGSTSPQLLITLECLRWNDNAIPNDKIVLKGSECARVTRRRVQGCPNLPSSSPSLTLELPPPQTSAPSAAAALVSNEVSTTVAVLVSLSTVLSVASAGGPLSQSLIAIGQSQCAPHAVKESTKGSRFLVSPFYALGDHAIVYGNVGLIACIIAMQLAAVRYFRTQALSVDDSMMRLERPTGHPTSSALSPEVRARFPNVAILAGGLGLQGLASTSLRMTFSDADSPASIVTGIIGLSATVAGLVGWRLAERSKTARTMRFRPYRVPEVRTSFLPPYLLPLGRWLPDEATATHGKLRSSVRAGCEWLGSYTSIYALFVSTFAAIPLPSGYCLGIWVPLSMVSAACCIVALKFRPARVPIVDVFNGLCFGSSAGLQLTSGIVTHQEINGEAFGGSAALLVGLTLIYTASTLLRGAHSGVVFLWERQFRTAENNSSPPQSNNVIDARKLRGSNFKRAGTPRAKSGELESPTIDSLFLHETQETWTQGVTLLQLEEPRERKRNVRHQHHWSAEELVPPLSHDEVMHNLSHLVAAASRTQHDRR